jgi:hypothetical protein
MKNTNLLLPAVFASLMKSAAVPHRSTLYNNRLQEEWSSDSAFRKLRSALLPRSASEAQNQ